MQRILWLMVLSVLSVSFAAADDNGLITMKSPYSVDETLDRFEQALKSKGMTIFTMAR